MNRQDHPEESAETAAAASVEPVPAAPADPVETGGDDELGRTVVALTADDIEPAQRRRLVGRLVDDIRRRGFGKLFRPKAAVGWIADAVADIAPHIPVRDLDTLRQHFDGLDGEELADRLVRNAANATAGVGAAGGGVAAVQWTVTPTLLTAPILLTAETIAIVSIELKLIGELHAVYGRPVTGSLQQRAVALIQAWSGKRGVNPFVPGAGVGTVLGTAARKELREMLLKRLGRNLTTLGPMLTGAAVAGYLNRRSTIAIGTAVRDDLRKLPIEGSLTRRAIDG